MAVTNVMPSVCGSPLFGGFDRAHEAWAGPATIAGAPAVAARKRDAAENGSKKRPWQLPV